MYNIQLGAYIVMYTYSCACICIYIHIYRIGGLESCQTCLLTGCIHVVCAELFDKIPTAVLRCSVVRFHDVLPDDTRKHCQQLGIKQVTFPGACPSCTLPV